VSAPRLGALAGKRVAVVEQYAYGDAVESAEGPRFIQGQSDQENLTKLLGGNVDAGRSRSAPQDS
jgi:ABC-type amino acid transport substrate-binding protein